MDRGGALHVTEGECGLHLVAGKFEPPGMPDRDACGECGRLRQMGVGFSPLPGRDRHETEDLPMERGDHRIAAFEREGEAIPGKTACFAETPLVRSDERDTAQSPCRMQLAAFECVAIHGSFGRALRLVPLPAVQQEAGELDEVERVVAAGPGLGPDQLPGQLDRPVEIIRQARDPERVTVRTLVLPGPSAQCDQAKPTLDVVVTSGSDQTQVGVGPQEEHVRKQVRVDHVTARLEQDGRLLDESEPALQVELHDEERDATEDPRPQLGVVDARLVERLLTQHDRLGHASVVVADEGADAQRLCPRRPGRCVPDRPLQDAVGLDHLGQVDEQALGGEPSATEALVGPISRRRPARLEIQRSSVESRATSASGRCCLSEGLGNGFIGPLGGLAEVSRPGVERRARRSQSSVCAAEHRGRHHAEDRLGHQWMPEPHLAVCERQEFPVDRGPQGVLGAGDYPLERLKGRLGGGGRQQQCVPRGLRQYRDAPGHQVTDRVGDRQWARLRGRVPRIGQRADDLERVQGVAAGRGLDAHERETRQ